jgi:hypothetical protein
MKSSKLKNLGSVVAFAFLLVSCGKSNAPTTQSAQLAAPNQTAAGQCPVGQIYQNQYGCVLQQQVCPAGQALYNGSCVPYQPCAAGMVSSPSGCVAMNNTSLPSTSVCAAGMVQTPMGCLPQAGCPGGQAMFNNSVCVNAFNTAANITNPTCTAGNVSTARFGCQPQSDCKLGFAKFKEECVLTNDPATCTNGSILTDKGCLSQGVCNPGQVSYEGKCYRLDYPAGFSAGVGLGFHFNWSLF